MITVISGTNRKNNQTLLFAKKYCDRLGEKGINCQLLSLESMPEDFTWSQLYDFSHPKIQEIINQFIVPSDKMVIVSPEYNGSFPGILKIFIDVVKPSYFKNKKIALVGISEGRSGNLRGLDHLTNILNYVNAEVLPYKLPVSKISSLINQGQVIDQELINAFDLQIEKLTKF